MTRAENSVFVGVMGVTFVSLENVQKISWGTSESEDKLLQRVDCGVMEDCGKCDYIYWDVGGKKIEKLLNRISSYKAPFELKIELPFHCYKHKVSVHFFMMRFVDCPSQQLKHRNCRTWSQEFSLHKCNLLWHKLDQENVKVKYLNRYLCLYI